MWSDGADSSRWIWLPPATKIDTSEPNHWQLPVGTKLWQEMRLLGKRVETRFLWKLAPPSLWFRTTYVWSDDENAAPELTIGVPNARGLPYEIPATSACEKCHGGSNDFVLGFEMVALAMPRSAGLNLQALVRARLLTNPPSTTPLVPGDPTTMGALSFLHTNCGTSCHNRNPGAGAGSTGLFLQLTAQASGSLPALAQDTDTWITSYKVPSMLAPGGVEAGTFLRLAPHNRAASAIAWTASRRDGVTQMPPIATHLVDQNDVTLLDMWIDELPP
jgi:hypothetical protein